MSDRHSGYLIILEHNIRDDDAQATIAALKQVRGVLGVEPVVSTPEETIAQARCRAELSLKLVDLAKEINVTRGSD